MYLYTDNSAKVCTCVFIFKFKWYSHPCGKYMYVQSVARLLYIIDIIICYIQKRYNTKNHIYLYNGRILKM